MSLIKGEKRQKQLRKTWLTEDRTSKKFPFKSLPWDYQWVKRTKSTCCLFDQLLTDLTPLPPTHPTIKNKLVSRLIAWVGSVWQCNATQCAEGVHHILIHWQVPGSCLIRTKLMAAKCRVEISLIRGSYSFLNTTISTFPKINRDRNSTGGKGML